MLLVKFEADWADEFDTLGFGAFEDENEFNDFLKKWKKRFAPATKEQAMQYFETTDENELIKHFEDVKEEYELDTEEAVLSWLADELQLNDVEFYFGTNEYHLFSEWCLFKDCFTIIEMDDVAINALMGDHKEIGVFPSLEYIVEYEYDDEDLE